MAKSSRKINFEELSEVKGEMRKSRITLDDMAQALGRSTSGLCKILNGDVDITRTTMKKITVYMNKKSANRTYSINDLFN